MPDHKRPSVPLKISHFILQGLGCFWVSVSRGLTSSDFRFRKAVLMEKGPKQGTRGFCSEVFSDLSERWCLNYTSGSRNTEERLKCYLRVASVGVNEKGEGQISDLADWVDGAPKRREGVLEKEVLDSKLRCSVLSMMRLKGKTEVFTDSFIQKIGFQEWDANPQGWDVDLGSLAHLLIKAGEWVHATAQRREDRTLARLNPTGNGS